MNCPYTSANKPRFFADEVERRIGLLHETTGVKAAKKAGDMTRARELTRRYDVDRDEVDQVTVKQLFATPGWVRNQLLRTSLVWICYAAAFTATNTYIVYWLTTFQGFSDTTATTMLLVASAAGWFFYVWGGLLGEDHGRQRMLLGSAAVRVLHVCAVP